MITFLPPRVIFLCPSLLVLLIWALAAAPSHAQTAGGSPSPARAKSTGRSFQSEIDKDFEEFFKGVDKDMKSFRETTAKQIVDFKEEIDREFTEFLRQQWVEKNLFLGKPRAEPLKPRETPIAAPPAKRSEPIEITEEPAVELAKPLPPPSPPFVPAAQTPDKTVAPAPDRPTGEPERFTVEPLFLGARVRIACDPRFKDVGLGAPLGNDSISSFWAEMSRLNYEGFLLQVQAEARTKRLNDWGYLRLLIAAAGELYPTRPDEAALFTWFILSKSGYRAKVAHDKARVHLLVAARQLAYGMSYLTFGGIRYYEIEWGPEDSRAKGLYTYEKDYPNAERMVDFRLPSYPSTERAPVARMLGFQWDGATHTVPIELDRSAIDFFRSYPQTEPNVYFTAAVDPALGRSLIHALGPLVEGKEEQEAVNILLRFVQTAFGYKTDLDQFGREKWLFLDETLYYPDSDCEDRSILFAWLVRHLVKLDVVGLDFPGHVATAVRFSDGSIAGSYITHQGRKYVICDPTYVNATIGMLIPRFKGTKPEIVEIL